jgi:YVTN family beta-propeller protein
MSWEGEMTTRLFCTDTDAGTITVLDASTDTPSVIGKITVGNSPRGAVMFTNTGRGFVGNSAGETISEIDAYSMREIAQIKVGIAPMGVGIIPGGKFALVSNSGSNYVSVVDLATRREVHHVAVGREPRHMAVTADGSHAYVSVSGSDSIAKIDLAGLSATPPRPSDVYQVHNIFVGTGAFPYSCAISPDGKTLLIANNQVPHATLIDLTTDTLAATVDLGSKGGRGTGFAPDGSIGFVTVEDVDQIIAIDVARHVVAARFPTGPGPRGFALDSRFIIFTAAFSRKTGTVTTLVTPNTVTTLPLGATTLATLASAQPAFREVQVGAGPCSVSIFTV